MPAPRILRLLHHRDPCPTKASKARAKALTRAIESSGMLAHRWYRWWPNYAGGLEASGFGVRTRVSIAITVTSRGRVIYSTLDLESSKYDRVLRHATDEEVVAALRDDMRPLLDADEYVPLTQSSNKR